MKRKNEESVAFSLFTCACHEHADGREPADDTHIDKDTLNAPRRATPVGIFHIDDNNAFTKRPSDLYAGTERIYLFAAVVCGRSKTNRKTKSASDIMTFMQALWWRIRIEWGNFRNLIVGDTSASSEPFTAEMQFARAHTQYKEM